MNTSTVTRNIREVSDVAWIRYDELAVDSSYQRPLIGGHIAYLKADWDTLFVGVLVVVERTPGRFFVVDGQHRWEAAIALGKGAETVRCLIIQGFGDVKLEALHFEKLNVQSKVRPDAVNKSKLSRREPHAVAREAILRSFGLTTDPKVAGSVKSLSTIEKIYNKDEGALLTQTIRVILNSFGMEGESLTQNIFKGVSDFIDRYRDEKAFTEAKLITRLKKFGEAERLRSAAVNYHNIMAPMSKATAMVAVMLNSYNRGRMQNKRLPV